MLVKNFRELPDDQRQIEFVDVPLRQIVDKPGDVLHKACSVLRDLFVDPQQVENLHGVMDVFICEASGEVHVKIFAFAGSNERIKSIPDEIGLLRRLQIPDQLG